VLENGDILAAWFAGTHEKNPDIAIWYARRKDGVWLPPSKVADCENIACWNPVLFNDGAGKIFLFYKVGAEITDWYTMLIISEDGGYTWSEPKELVEGDIGVRGPVKNKLIVLSNGWWAAPASIETKTLWDAFVDISKDQGKTWIKSAMVPIDHSKLEGKGIIQPTLWESAPGKVHMLLRSSEGKIYRSDSEDFGLTWCEAYPISLPNNNSGIDLVQLPDGKLVLVYNPVSGNWAARTPLVCSYSEDNGQTWKEEFVLEHNPEPKSKGDASFSYPAIVENNGNLYITYTWNMQKSSISSCIAFAVLSTSSPLHFVLPLFVRRVYDQPLLKSFNRNQDSRTNPYDWKSRLFYKFVGLRQTNAHLCRQFLHTHGRLFHFHFPPYLDSCFGFYIHRSLPFLRQPPARGLPVSACSRGAPAFTIVAAMLQKYLLRADYSVVKEPEIKQFYNLFLFSMSLYNTM
jgi:predicted neuraminidase